MPRDCPTLFKRKNSKWWWFSWYTETGRIQGSAREFNLTTSEYTKSQALEILLQKLELITPETSETPQKSLIFFKRDLRYRLTREGKRTGTVKLYMDSLDRLIEICGEDCSYENIKRSDVSRLQDYLFKKGNSPAYINLHCRHLRAAFERLYDDEFIERNPFRKFKKLSDYSEKPKYLTDDEIKRFLEVVNSEKKEEYRRLIYIYLFTGRRRSEVLEIDREDVDIKNGLVKFVNNKDSHHRKQTLAIPSVIKEDFAWFLKKYRSNKPFKIVKPNSMTRIVKRFMIKARLPNHYHLHNLRHTFVSKALEEGENIWDIKEYLGHSTVKVTEVYAHGKDIKKEINIGVKKYT